MPRFVILEHDHPHLHWDLMLEDGDTLRTWRLDQAPTDWTRVDGEELVPHRRVYLDYEGEVSGGRGWVKRWDWGEYEPIHILHDRELHRYRGRQGDGGMLIQRVESGKWRVLIYVLPPISGSASSRSVPPRVAE